MILCILNSTSSPPLVSYKNKCAMQNQKFKSHHTR